MRLKKTIHTFFGSKISTFFSNQDRLKKKKRLYVSTQKKNAYIVCDIPPTNLKPKLVKYNKTKCNIMTHGSKNS